MDICLKICMNALVVCVTALLLVRTCNMHVIYSFNMHETCVLHVCLPAPVQYSHSLLSINQVHCNRSHYRSVYIVHRIPYGALMTQYKGFMIC